MSNKSFNLKETWNIFKIKNFGILFVGQFISKMGSAINTVGLSLYVLKFDNALMGMGTLSLLLVLPWIIFGPYAGVLADRHSKKTIIVLCDIARGFLSILLFFVPNIGLFYMVILALTMFDVLFSPAIGGYISFVVSKDDITKANSLYSGAGELAYLVGPAVGGFLVATLGSGLVFVVNGISFIVSGLSELFITESGKVVKSDIEEKLKTSMKEEIVEGFRYINRHRSLRFIIFFFAIASAGFGGYSILYSTVAIEHLHLSDQLYGLFSTVSGLGAFVGALILPCILKKLSEINVMLGGVGFYAMLYLIFALVKWIPGNMAIVFLIGNLGSFINVTYGIYLQKSVDQKYIGRVYSLDMSLSNFTMVFSILFITIFGASFGSKNLLITFSVVLFLITFVTILYEKYLIKKLGKQDS